jgi:hypothetical protein
MFFVRVGTAVVGFIYLAGRTPMPRKRNIEERIREATENMVRLRDEKKMIEIKDRMKKRTPRRKRGK